VSLFVKEREHACARMRESEREKKIARERGKDRENKREEEHMHTYEGHSL